MWSWLGTNPLDAHTTQACHPVEDSRLSEASSGGGGRTSQEVQELTPLPPGAAEELVSGYFTGLQSLLHVNSGPSVTQVLPHLGQVYMNNLTSPHPDSLPFENHGSPLSSLIFKSGGGTGSQSGDPPLVHPCENHFQGLGSLLLALPMPPNNQTVADTASSFPRF